jgi:hypothetical protein
MREVFVDTEQTHDQQENAPREKKKAISKDEPKLPPQDRLVVENREKKQQLEQGMGPQQIHFATGQQAQLIVPPPDTGAEEILAALKLEQPEVVFLIIGGANDRGDDFLAQPPVPVNHNKKKDGRTARRKRPSTLDVLMEGSSAETAKEGIISRGSYLTQLFSRGIARSAVNTKAVIIDGGRQTSMMALMGQGVVDRGRRTTLIGVAPASKVTYPGSPVQETAKGYEPLDPNHTHFVLTAGERWGDETETMYQLAAALAKNKPVVTILVNGGSVAKTQLLASVRLGWPVILIKGSGHLADEINELWQNRPSFIPDPGLAEIIEDGRLHFLPIEDAINGFGRLIEQLLYQQQPHINRPELAEMAPQIIRFPNKKQARVVVSESGTDPEKILKALELEQPEAVLLLLGGSAELNEAIARLNLGTLGKYLGKYGNGEVSNLKPGKSSPKATPMSQALMDNIYNLLIDADEDGSVPTVHRISMEALAHMVQLFRLGIGPAAAAAGAIIIDGGRRTGVMAMMGQATLHQGHDLELIGVAPAGKVTYPGGPAEGSLRDGEPLDHNHTHFVLTEGEHWGDETETMYNLAAALARGGSKGVKGVKAEGKPPVAKDKLVITILVNGNSLAKEQLVYSVQRGWPVVVIKGSGNLADEIARLWQTKPAFIPDPDLAEIITNGKLHVLDLKSSATDFKALLAQLFNYQRLRHHQSDATTIEQAWKIFGTYDAAASRQQRQFRRIQFWVLLLGVLATFLALTKKTLEGFDNLPAYYTLIDWNLYYIILVIPIIITALAAAANEFSAGKKWILLRASAESIKKEIYRYRAKAEVYSDQETKTLSREQKLQQRINTISANLMNGEAKLAAIKDYRGPLPPPYGAHPEDDGLTLLTPERYLPLRLEDQYNFYKSRTIKLERKLQRLQWLIYLIGGAGTLLVALGLELWIALTTALVTAFTTYLEYQQVENTLMRYNKTATDLNRIMVWWEALSVEEQADPKNVSRLVGRTEAAIYSEHAAWVHEMQDVIDELMAQQGQQEDDKAKDHQAEKVSPAEAADILKLFEEEEIVDDQELDAEVKDEEVQADQTETSAQREAEVSAAVKGSTTREKKSVS